MYTLNVFRVAFFSILKLDNYVKDDDCSDISEVDPLLHSELVTQEFISLRTFSRQTQSHVFSMQ